jgi:hypothetical protein
VAEEYARAVTGNEISLWRKARFAASTIRFLSGEVMLLSLAALLSVW